MDWYTYFISGRMGSYAIPNRIWIYSRDFTTLKFGDYSSHFFNTSQYPYPHMTMYHKVWQFRLQLLFFKSLTAKLLTVMYDSHNLRAVTKHTSIKWRILLGECHVVNRNQRVFFWKNKIIFNDDWYTLMSVYGPHCFKHRVNRTLDTVQQNKLRRTLL